MFLYTHLNRVIFDFIQQEVSILSLIRILLFDQVLVILFKKIHRSTSCSLHFVKPLALLTETYVLPVFFVILTLLLIPGAR